MSVNKIGFKISRIKTEEFATIGDSRDLDENLDAGISINTSFGIDPDNYVVACLLDIQYEQKDKAIIAFKQSCEFEIEKESWNSCIDKDGKNITFKKGFLHHLLVLVVGVSRGVLHARTENTPYNKFHLPAINVTEIVGSDISFPLSN